MRLLVLIAALMLSVGARAQTIVINPPATGSAPAKAQRVTIAVTLSTIVGGTTATEPTAALTEANQTLFAIVNHQCDVLAPLLRGDCRLVQINTNGTINDRQNFGGQQGTPSTSVTANATYEMTPKPGLPTVR